MSMGLTQCPDCGQITSYNAAAIGQQLVICPAGHSFIAEKHRIADDIAPHGRKVDPALIRAAGFDVPAVLKNSQLTPDSKSGAS